MNIFTTRWALLFLMWSFGLTSVGQQSVSLLRTNAATAGTSGVLRSGVQSFDFSRGLIHFKAARDGEDGNFILDTGAPKLLINDRGENQDTYATVGLGLGGSVALANLKVESFRMAGKDHGRHWALALDLRPLEARTGRKIDGFVGYDLLRYGELRINYPAREFELRKSERRPRFANAAPRHVFKMEFVDHLPVIALKVNGRKLYFAIDTGAGSNLIDPARIGELLTGTEEHINVQGLDGEAGNYELAVLDEVDELALSAAQRTFVTMPLEHLRLGSELPVVGILGSDFLENYVVGLDYRRRRVCLW